MQETVMAQADTFSADGLLNMWLGGNSNSAMDALRDSISGVRSQGLARSRATSMGKEASRE
jgi:hypothetical protein